SGAWPNPRHPSRRWSSSPARLEWGKAQHLSTPRPRDHIPGLEPYKLAERDASGRRLIRLDQNENAADPSPAAIAAAQAALIEANRYPEGDAASLRAAIAETEGLPADQIICGAGSMELLGLIAQAYLRPGDEAVVS